MVLRNTIKLYDVKCDQHIENLFCSWRFVLKTALTLAQTPCSPSSRLALNPLVWHPLVDGLFYSASAAAQKQRGAAAKPFFSRTHRYTLLYTGQNMYKQPNTINLQHLCNIFKVKILID